ISYESTKYLMPIKKRFMTVFEITPCSSWRKYDFKIVATWESKKDNRTEFVYLLEWPDRETMAAVGRNSCGTRNGSRSRRRRVKCMARSSARYRIAPCI